MRNFSIVGGQRLSRGRDVEGAVPYKRDRIVFFVLSYTGCNRGLVSSTGERCSPLQIFGIVYLAAKSLRSLRIYIALRARKAVQI